VTASTVLVTGATGLLGPYLAAAAGRLGRVVTSGRRGGERPCDLTDRTAARDMMGEFRPAIVEEFKKTLIKAKKDIPSELE